MASRLMRTNAVTVNDVLDGHKPLEIDCADRVYLTLPVPGLVGRSGGQLLERPRAQLPGLTSVITLVCGW
jgi:hypothetical protein